MLTNMHLAIESVYQLALLIVPFEINAPLAVSAAPFCRAGAVV